MENVYLIYKNNRGGYTVELKSGSYTLALATTSSKFKAISITKMLKNMNNISAMIFDDKDDPDKSYVSYSIGFRSPTYSSNKAANKCKERFLLVYQHAKIFIAI